MSTESDDDGARSERSQGGQGARGAVEETRGAGLGNVAEDSADAEADARVI